MRIKSLATKIMIPVNLAMFIVFALIAVILLFSSLSQEEVMIGLFFEKAALQIQQDLKKLDNPVEEAAEAIHFKQILEHTRYDNVESYNIQFALVDKEHTIFASSISTAKGMSLKDNPSYLDARKRVIENNIQHHEINDSYSFQMELDSTTYQGTYSSIGEYGLLSFVDLGYASRLVLYYIIAILIITFIVLPAIIKLVLWATLRRVILKPLEQMQQMMNTFALGNLNARVHLKSNDEIKVLGNSINQMAERVGSIIEKIGNATEHVSNSNTELRSTMQKNTHTIEELFGSIEQINQNIQSQSSFVEQTSAIIEEMVASIENVGKNIDTQASAVSQTASSIEEMASSIQSVATMTSKANEIAGNLSGVAKDGSDTVQSAMQAIEDIEYSSNQISETVTLISSIAEQTNLLAMNASIEAAHAGEYGKGFAVVADEIRKLAEGTSSSANETTAILKEILDKISNAVNQSQRANQGLQRILDYVTDTTSINNEINIAMNEQESAAKEVLQTMTSLTQISEEVKSTTVEQRTGSSEILLAVQQLQDTTIAIVDATKQEAEYSNTIRESIQEVEQIIAQNEAVIQELKDSTSFFNTFDAESTQLTER